ncbi:MAG: class I SAM-dependent methyltransferase [Cyclobacteriaceae bacterium]|nr:class I SAM-dependent methyltransferase [Cyclobacteriaceae bacterium]
MKDRFSDQARQYAAFRPHYPKELYDFIFKQVKSFDLAWDAGTGNGQAAQVLATRFRKVLATDISAKQLVEAVRKENIVYEVAGETTQLPDQSVDLVTVAQAIHWFDRPAFYEEVNRVAKPGGVIAVWVYGLLKVSPEIDPLIHDFYTHIVGPYWDPERKLIDDELKTMEFPFEEIATPSFRMRFKWTLGELEGYLNTWSATQKFIHEKAANPVTELVDRIGSINAAALYSVEFPLILRLGRVHGHR